MATTIEASAANGLTADTLAKLDGVPLASFLERQRWFSTKHDARTATLTEIVPLFPKYDAVFAQVEVKERGGSAIASYLLPIALVDKPANDACVIAKLSQGELYLVDAAHDAGFRTVLLDYLSSGTKFQNDGTQLRFEHYAPFDLPRDTSSRVLSGEQSNTSIVYGDALIVKLFRKLTAGENPDIEIGALLTERGSAVSPALVGSATLDGDRGPTALAMAQRLVPGARDLWAHVTDQLKALCTNAGSQPFIDEAETLGRTTRELHEVLASVTDQRAFAPARATHDDVVRWCSAIRREIQDTVTLLARTPNLPAGDSNAAPSREQITAQGLADIEQHDAILADIAALENAGELDAGLTIRHHGDYHLGQVLRDSGGHLYIIDFEGEPSRPLAERRALHSPLRDVAGMLRSFAYAACITASNCASSSEPLPWADALQRSSAWESAACDAFMRGYLATSSETLPRDTATTERLVRLFAIEKAFYELRYELGFRRDWVWVPMRGISALARGSVVRTP